MFTLAISIGVTLQLTDGVPSIVLAGHPRLRNALMRPNMEEVGSGEQTNGKPM